MLSVTWINPDFSRTGSVPTHLYAESLTGIIPKYAGLDESRHALYAESLTGLITTTTDNSQYNDIFLVKAYAEYIRLVKWVSETLV